MFSKARQVVLNALTQFGARVMNFFRERVSLLYLKILAINLTVLLIPVGSFLYSDEYRKGFIQAELAAMQAEGQLIALALAGGAVRANSFGMNELDIQISQQWLQLFSKRTDSRIRLFTPDGELQLDSIRQGKSAQSYQVEKLDMEQRKNSFKLLDWLFRLGSQRENLELYIEHPVQQASQYLEVGNALGGQPSHAQRVDDAGNLVLSIALPIQRLRRVQGAILLSRDNTGIEKKVNQIRLDALRYTVWAFVFTFMLSIYIAWTIAHPVRRLARLADDIRISKPHQVRLPDLTYRRDEIGDLSKSLIDMTEALWDRINAIERFAADVSHEIKNPLTSLRSAVETASMIKDEAKLKMLLDVIIKDVDRLDRLITDISDASRLDAELNRAEVQVVDVALLIKMLSDSHNLTRKEGVPKLDYQILGGDNQHVIGLEGRLGQVIRNLLGNAVSFSPEDSTIVLRSVLRADRYIEITMRDQGPGIPLGKEEAIFDRFFTDRPASQGFGNHSGLGLAISRQIIEAMGGKLKARNLVDDQGQVLGAEFTITLPSLAITHKNIKKSERHAS